MKTLILIPVFGAALAIAQDTPTPGAMKMDCLTKIVTSEVRTACEGILNVSLPPPPITTGEKPIACYVQVGAGAITSGKPRLVMVSPSRVSEVLFLDRAKLPTHGSGEARYYYFFVGAVVSKPEWDALPAANRLAIIYSSQFSSAIVTEPCVNAFLQLINVAGQSPVVTP